MMTWAVQLLKVADFGTDQKPVYSFQIESYYLALFSSYCGLVKLSLLVPIFKFLIRGDPLKSG